jgi:vitamin B12 transporter
MTFKNALSFSLISTAALLAATNQICAQQPIINLPSVEVQGADAKPTRAPTASNVRPTDSVVTATTSPTPDQNVASSVTVITGKDLEREQRRTVADALRAVPGLNVVQTGAVGGQTSVFMRGTNSNHVKIYIDGIDVSDPSVVTGAFDFGHLTVSDVERIEVLRGPQSGLYGANSLGGVISIVTKQGKGPPRTSAYFEGGSFGTFNQGASLSGSEGNVSYSLNVGHLRSADTQVTPPELRVPGQKLKGDLYDNWTYSAKIGIDVSRNFSVNLVGRYTEATKLFTSGFALPLDSTHTGTDVAQFFGRAETVTTLYGGAWKSFFSIARSDLTTLTKGPGGNSSNDGDRNKVDWRNVFTIVPGQTLTVGVERTVESIDTRSAFSSLYAGEWNNAGYVELQSKFGKYFSVAVNGRYDDNQTFGNHPTFRFAPAMLIPGTDTKLKASVGTGFRAPSLNERFFQSVFFNGNPNLKPEESTGWDVGFEQPIFDQKVRFGVTYFHNDITNLINSTSAPFPVANTYVNVGQATTWGYESFVSAAVTRDVTVRGDYTYTHAFDAVTGNELLRRPRHKASATATWTPTKSITLSGTVLHTGSYLDNDRFFSSPVPFDTKPYTIVNLASSYQVNDAMTLFARVDNLFDVQYQDPTGFMRPGLGVFGGVKLTSW